jgi:DNA-binding MarR family transcriptional regulator
MTTTIGAPRTAVSDDWWGELDASVLDYLARRGGASPEEIGHAVGLSPASAASVLAMLINEGKVRITRVEGIARRRAAA